VPVIYDLHLEGRISKGDVKSFSLVADPVVAGDAINTNTMRMVEFVW